MAEVPTTDPKQLKDRRVTIALSELDETFKTYLNIVFRIVKSEGKNAYTRFDGCIAPREFLYRLVRKRTEKVETIDYIKTRDGWKLKVKILTILNRRTPYNIETKTRHKISEILNNYASKYILDDFLKLIFIKKIQNDIKKTVTKIYPVRFCEIAKISVVKIPEN